MPRFPYFVPGILAGGEMRDLETLEALVRDLRRYADGSPPDGPEIAAAPSVASWAAVDDASAVRIAGLVDGHPRVGPGPAVTSRVYAMDNDRRWVRTYSRLWRLHDPLPTRRPGDV